MKTVVLPACALMCSMTTTASARDCAAGWLPWVPGLGLDGVVWELAVFDPDGAGPGLPVLVAGGEFALPGGSNLAAWNGSHWQPFPQSPFVDEPNSFSVTDMAVFDEDGGGPNPPRLFVGGDLTRVGATPMNRIARWNGQAWSALGGGLNGRVRALAALDPDGPGPEPVKLFVGGDFSSAGGVPANKLAVWDGLQWSALGAGVGVPEHEGVYSFAAYDDDGAGPHPWTLFCSGWFSGTPGNPLTCSAQWDAQGAAWANFGGGLAGQTDGLIVSDGSSGAPAGLLATGYFQSAGGNAANHLAVWNGANWQQVANGSWSSFDKYPVVYEAVPFVDQGAPSLAICGNFTVAAGTPALGVAFLRNGQTYPLGVGTNGGVTALARFDPDGPGPIPTLLMCGGGFTTAGGHAAAAIAAWGPLPPDGDANMDYVVNFADITSVLTNFGATYSDSGPGDANGNGVVNFADITEVLVAFGQSCP